MAPMIKWEIQSDKDWPLGRPADEVLRDVLLNAFKVPVRKRTGIQLWSEVGRLIGYGSTSSMQLCNHLGLDPFALVVRRR